MRDEPSQLAAFGMAVLGVLCAWGAHAALSPFIGDRMPFLTFFPMLFLLAGWGGFWATSYAAILSAAVLIYAILEPIGAFAVAAPEYRVGLVLYLAVAL